MSPLHCTYIVALATIKVAIIGFLFGIQPMVIDCSSIYTCTCIIIYAHWQLCNNTNTIPNRSRYAGTYTVAIAGWYRWEGLGGQGMGCEWLAGLVW